VTATLKMQADVFRLPLPKGEAVYFDAGKPRERVAGLALRIREAGSRKWVFFYRWGGRLQKITIGDATAWSLEKARMRAREYRVKIDSGTNPGDAKLAEKIEQARRPTIFSVLAHEYLAAKQHTLRSRSIGESKRHLEKHWKPFHGLPLATIERSDVAAQLRVIAERSGPVASDRARSTLSAFFAWAIGEGICETNPVTGTNKASLDKPRDRTLSDAELAAVWKAAPANDYGHIVQLIILTGCRRDEIGGLRWSEIDIDDRKIILPKERTKNGAQHVVPLSNPALEILESRKRRVGRDLIFGEGEGGYSGWSRSKARLDESLELKSWTLHDLRRTVRTGLGKLSVSPHVSEAILNHLPPKLIRTYDTNKYEAEKRAGIDLWANHLQIIVAQSEGANVRRLIRA
jgi:integrase